VPQLPDNLVQKMSNNTVLSHNRLPLSTGQALALFKYQLFCDICNQQMSSFKKLRREFDQ
jgi:hypothetical protein